MNLLESDLEWLTIWFGDPNRLSLPNGHGLLKGGKSELVVGFA